MIIAPAKRLADVQEYYFSRKLQQIRTMIASGLDVINLGIGSPDLAPSEATINKLSEVARKPGSHGYQGYKGVPELRKGIAGWMHRVYGVQPDPETEILPLLGSKEGIMHISMAFLNEGDKVLVPDPGYPTYSSVSRLVGATESIYSLNEKNGWAPDLDALEKSDLSGVKLMWINYPNMPTGAKATDKIFTGLIAFARKHGILLCHDNPYSTILHDGKLRSILAYPGAMEVALELNSLSKSHHMAGWRVGWIAGGKDYLDTVLKVKSNVDSGMFLGVQLAAVEAFNNSDEWHRQQNAEYAERRKKAWEMLDLLGCLYSRDQVGMFVWAKVPDRVTDVESMVEDILTQAHVFITPGFIFGKNGHRYVRVSLCTPVKRLQEALDRLKKYTLTHAVS